MKTKLYNLEKLDIKTLPRVDHMADAAECNALAKSEKFLVPLVLGIDMKVLKALGILRAYRLSDGTLKLRKKGWQIALAPSEDVIGRQCTRNSLISLTRSKKPSVTKAYCFTDTDNSMQKLTVEVTHE